MKYSKLVFIFLGCMTVFFACSHKPVIKNSAVSDQDSTMLLEKFKIVVAEVSELMSVATPEVAVWPYPMPADSNIYIWFEQTKSAEPERINIYTNFLFNRPEVAFRQCVIYEYCRMKLELSEDRNQMSDVEKLLHGRCIYEWLGEDDFIKYLLYVAKVFPEHSYLAEATREELIITVRKYYKKRVPAPTVSGNLPVIEQLKIILASIMQLQEYKMGIKFDAPPPQIIFGENMRGNDIATYLPEEKKIIVHPLYKIYDLSPLIDNLTKPVLAGGDSTIIIVLRDILAHESGHYYTHLFLERYPQDSWMSEYFIKYVGLNNDNLGAIMVIEGIGEYFKKVFTLNRIVEFNQDKWNKKYSPEDFGHHLFMRNLIYGGGYALVNTILENCELDAGLAWIIQNELCIDTPDISIVNKYQSRALEEVKKK